MNKLYFVLTMMVFVFLTNSYSQPFNHLYNINCEGHIYTTTTENYDSDHIPYMMDMTIFTYCISCEDHLKIKNIGNLGERDSIKYLILKRYKPYEHNIIRSASKKLIDPYTLFYIQSGDREFDFKFPCAEYNSKPRFIVLKERKLNAIYDFHMARMVLEFYSNETLIKKVDCNKLWYNLAEEIKEFSKELSHLNVIVTNDFNDEIKMTFLTKDL